MESFKLHSLAKKPDVAMQLSSEHQWQADENLCRLRSVVSTVVFCGKQNIVPLCGHRHELHATCFSSNAANSGNFVALMNFQAEVGDKCAAGTFP